MAMIIVDRELERELKRLAALEGQSVEDLLTDMLRARRVSGKGSAVEASSSAVLQSIWQRHGLVPDRETEPLDKSFFDAFSDD